MSSGSGAGAPSSNLHRMSAPPRKLIKCKLDRILGSKQYFWSYGFLLFWSYGHFYLFIRYSEFGLLDQLRASLLDIGVLVKCSDAFNTGSVFEL